MKNDHLKGKLIVVGTMGRSGSTVLTQILLLLVKHSMIEYNYSEQAGSIDNCLDLNKIIDPNKLNIIKAHHNINGYGERADYVFTCMRDLREIMASTKKYVGYFPRGGIIKECELQIGIYNSWLPYNTHCFKYMEYVNNIKKYCDDISKILNLEKVDYKLVENDLFNNINHNHITSKDVSLKEYKSVLSNVEIENIENNFRNFLLENGYLINE